MPHDQRLFERRSDWDANGRKYTSHYVIHCHACNETDVIRFNKINQSLPPDLIAKQFHQHGWVIGNTRKNDLCPKCINGLSRDKTRRKEMADREKKRALARLVIAQGKVHKQPVEETRREHFVLLDRMAEVERQATFLESTVEELINQVADLRTEHTAILRRLTEAAPPPTPEPIGEPAPQQEQDMTFEPIPASRAPLPTSHDRDQCAIGYKSPRSTIRIGRNIAAQLGWTPGSHVDILAGDGEDTGYIQVASVDGNGGGSYIIRNPNPRQTGYNALTVASTYLRPNLDQPVEMTGVEHKIEDGALRLRLPATFA